MWITAVRKQVCQCHDDAVFKLDTAQRTNRVPQLLAALAAISQRQSGAAAAQSCCDAVARCSPATARLCFAACQNPSFDTAGKRYGLLAEPNLVLVTTRHQTAAAQLNQLQHTHLNTAFLRARSKCHNSAKPLPLHAPFPPCFDLCDCCSCQDFEACWSALDKNAESAMFFRMLSSSRSMHKQTISGSGIQHRTPCFPVLQAALFGVGCIAVLCTCTGCVRWIKHRAVMGKKLMHCCMQIVNNSASHSSITTTCEIAAW